MKGFILILTVVIGGVIFTTKRAIAENQKENDPCYYLTGNGVIQGIVKNGICIYK